MTCFHRRHQKVKGFCPYCIKGLNLDAIDANVEGIELQVINSDHSDFTIIRVHDERTGYKDRSAILLRPRWNYLIRLREAKYALVISATISRRLKKADALRDHQESEKRKESSTQEEESDYPN